MKGGWSTGKVELCLRVLQSRSVAEGQAQGWGKGVCLSHGHPGHILLCFFPGLAREWPESSASPWRQAHQCVVVGLASQGPYSV